MKPDENASPNDSSTIPAGQGPVVLCVDDDPNISEALARRLHSHGIRVLRAFQGMQGLWQAVTEKPDLILLDLVMPNGSGEEVLDLLSGNVQTAGIPVIILSGKIHPSLCRHLENHGAVRCFSKPIPFEELLEEIRRHLQVTT